MGLAVEREAFARAWRFLSYKPLAKWAALIAAVATAVLYVAFLVLLGLYADLIVNGGGIPAFTELPPRERERFLHAWETVPPADYLQTWAKLRTDKRKQLLQDTGVEGSKVEELASVGDPEQLSAGDKELIYRTYLDPLVRERKERLADIGLEDREAELLANAGDPHDLPPRDKEVLWRAHVYQILRHRVGPGAAAFVTAKGPPEDFADRGLLSLVVRSNDRYYGPLAGTLARWFPWTWQSGNLSRSNFANYLTGLLIVAVILAVLRALAMFVMNQAAARAATEASTRLRRAVYHHTFRLGTLAFRALGPGEAVGIFTRQVETVHNGLYAWLTVVYREPVKFVLLLAFALAVNFWLSLAFLIFAVLVWLVGGQVAAYYRRQERAALHRAAEQLALLQESLMMMRLVKCYLMELFNQSRVERQLAHHAADLLRRYRGEAIYRPLLIFLGTLAAAVLLFVAGLIVLSGSLGVASLITLAAALVSLYLPVVNWLEERRLLRRTREAAAILFKFLDRPGEVGQVVGAGFLPPLSKRLEFDNVSLREPGTGRKLLQGVSLTIQANQRIALVGPDDTEKHALVYLLPRFLDPEAGEIRIDDQNLRWVTFDSLRAQIAIVLQHNLTFNDTVANNIGCGDAGYDLPKIIEAAKLAHAHQFIQKLPKGYETVIGEMGHYLPIGEQFRIALARAIIRDPALLVIEEPAAPLDEDTKDLVDDTFARVLPGRTVIFLPHRLSTIRACDRVLFLHRGRVEAAGEHRDLLAQNQLYRHLQYIEFNEFAEQV
jgi:ATP-binding cassette subfamily B protein